MCSELRAALFIGIEREKRLVSPAVRNQSHVGYSIGGVTTEWVVARTDVRW